MQASVAQLNGRDRKRCALFPKEYRSYKTDCYALEKYFKAQRLGLLYCRIYKGDSYIPERT